MPDSDSAVPAVQCREHSDAWAHLWAWLQRWRRCAAPHALSCRRSPLQRSPARPGPSPASACRPRPAHTYLYSLAIAVLDALSGKCKAAPSRFSPETQRAHHAHGCSAQSQRVACSHRLRAGDAPEGLGSCVLCSFPCACSRIRLVARACRAQATSKHQLHLRGRHGRQLPRSAAGPTHPSPPSWQPSSRLAGSPGHRLQPCQPALLPG